MADVPDDMTRTPRRTRIPTRVLAALAAITLIGVAVAGCSSSGSGSDSADTAGSNNARAAEAGDKGAAGGTPAEMPNSYSADGSDSLDSALVETASRPDTESPERAVISTGNVALKSDDVAKARFDVQKVVDKFRGEVSQEKTETDDEGEVNRSRLVVRIPTADFADAMGALEGAADLISSDTKTDDVTTQVIDINIRVRVQRRSIARIELLLDRAQSIRDIINIESQLSRRQAQLGSLERQQAYLADQTQMSTITVSLERTDKKAPAEKKDDATGFVAGLKSGWHGLTTVAVGLATVTGALLPFALVLLILAIPGWPLVRRLRRPTTTPAPEPAP